MPAAIRLTDWMATAQDPMRRGLIQKITNESIFLRLLHFVQVKGFSYSYGEQATLGGIAFRGLNESYSPDTGIINPQIEYLAMFGGITAVDYALDAVPDSSARANAILAKTRAAGLYYDRMVIDGDPGVTSKSFWGLNSRITGSQLLYPAADAGNGGALALTDIDRLIDAVAGPNNSKVLVMCKADRRTLKQLVLSSAHGAGIMDVGKALPSYDDVTIEVIDEDGDLTPILTKDETRGSSNLTSSIYCVRPGQSEEGEWFQGLVMNEIVRHLPLAQTNTQIQDLIEMFGGIAVFHKRAVSRLAGIL